MINSKKIYQDANKLRRQTGSTNMETLAHSLGIHIYYQDDFKQLLGMYTCIQRKKAILLNARLDEHMKQMVIAHELGHDRLHKHLVRNGGVREFELFDIKNTVEYEANAYASHLILDTDEFVELARSGQDVMQIACSMNSHVNLILIKLRELIRLGYDLRMPMDTHGDFLKNIRV